MHSYYSRILLIKPISIALNCTEIRQLKRILNDILDNTNYIENIVTNLINQIRGHLNRYLAEKFNKFTYDSTKSKFIPNTKKTDITNVVVDLTGELNENEKEVLALGHNFTLMNDNINNKTLTVDIENACIIARNIWKVRRIIL